MSRELKIEAARAAIAHVKPGMRLGIGSGSTADEFTRLLGEAVAAGLEITGVPTSENTAALCREVGVTIRTLDELPQLDLVVDGADEVDGQLNLIKGGGGALLREKIVASAAARMIVIADDSKLVETLGKYPLPIEVNPFGLAVTRATLEKAAASLGLSGEIALRGGETEPFVTDGGHFILDASFGHIADAQALSAKLLEIPGVVEHGLFLGYANLVLLAGSDGIRQLGEL